MSCAVYMLIGDDGRPFYVGASKEVDQRLRTHEVDKTVYDALGGRTKREATQRVEVVPCNESDLRVTELNLIKKYRPVLNVVGNNDKPLPLPPPPAKPLSAAEQARCDEYVRQTVAAAPPLTSEQRSALAELLRPGVTAATGAEGGDNAT